MFCIYCGATNPDDATFCSGCGKLARGTPASPPAEPAKRVPIPPAHEAPKITPLSPPVVAAAPAPPAVGAAKKRRVGWGWIVFILIILFFLIYPIRGGGTVCEATRDVAVQQVPYAVEILAARYPLQVGVLRSAMNDQGAVDKLAEDYVRNSMLSQQDPGRLNCYIAYYIVIFNKDKVRTAEADWIEKQLQLK